MSLPIDVAAPVNWRIGAFAPKDHVLLAFGPAWACMPCDGTIPFDADDGPWDIVELRPEHAAIDSTRTVTIDGAARRRNMILVPYLKVEMFAEKSLHMNE